MLNAIIKFSIENKLIVVLLIVGLIGWGSYSITQLPIDALPDITNNQVQILTTAPSQSTLDIERLVTFPIEQAMSTIPDIQEIRSMSRSGQSIVTVVFSDHADLYWARQQVSERLLEANKKIPLAVGSPELAPITTGLGEIYQYELKVAQGYEKRYSITDLRTIQDWYIRRQLIGTEGVAEVSSFGGYVKQYEIAISPEKIRSLNLSISEVYQAVSQNNENTGGAYIEKNKSAYFIRSEGLIGSMDDLANIVVRKKESGAPLLMRDVATIRTGHAIRFGAMTRDGTDEAVGAVVMMLKGANSSQVIAAVKERVLEIGKTLPEGVSIEPFLDRTKLVKHAIQTVVQNLAEGALIVIFVLVLLLGNLRAGIIVASVIPLSMLFAVIMMNIFGVSGNLMSLGAIDFGLIVDGAVIIVEATLHHIGVSGFSTKLSQSQMDNEVKTSADKMMNSAAFGQIIILIVYLPILSLVGIEGKMFKPMAQTVIFAILGAFLLSLTYVPMISALFLSKEVSTKQTISEKVLDKIHKRYEPLLRWSLMHKMVVVGIACILLVISLFVFSRLGGEFLPSLDEGDFAVETRLLTGSSLSTTIDVTIKAEKVLLEKFPEIEKIVAKIGTSEIPTDPMPFDAADLIIVMKEKSKWVSANTKDEMITKMKKVLNENVPGTSFGFQHPIQMRFNELITGARQDVVIKIYGDDLEQLSGYAQQIGKIASNVEGTTDHYVEPILGTPQIVIKVNRQRLAEYGISISEVNQVINAALAGQTAGIVYEGEKRFDVVVRMGAENRRSAEDVKGLYVTTNGGQQVPLSQLADIKVETGPAQIQRDGTKRRIVVGFNTRGRDVQSIVNELRASIDSSVKLQPGYRIAYGGTFENLQKAKARLAVAVPVSLALIFILLYFAFSSVKQSFMIYSSIPLAAIGGVLALLVRDMPFSISAGIGFIALFGVAVLNGIVLVAEFNRLKKDGLTDLNEIIMKGTNTRLRPVLMTATVASLGFLPMALSHGSGAEVQKPLATVVIGGLISATLLTLFVLPVLYVIVERRWGKVNKTLIIFLLAAAIPMFSQGQSRPVSLSEALNAAMQKNPAVSASYLDIEKQRQLKKASVDLPKTDVMFLYGQYNSVYKGDNNITISQTIPFPGVFVHNSALGREQIRSSELKSDVTKNDLILQVSSTYNHLLFLKARQQFLIYEDSILRELVRATGLQYKTGESTLLIKTLAETQYAEVRNLLQRNRSDVKNVLDQLRLICQSPEIEDVTGDLESLYASTVIDTAGVHANPQILAEDQQIKVSYQSQKLEAAKASPDFHIGYFNQTLIGFQNIDGQEKYFGTSNRFQGIQAGISFPIWFTPYASRIKAARISTEFTRKFSEATKLNVSRQYRQAVQDLMKNKSSLEYYRNTALPTAELLLDQSQKSFRSGEADITSLLLSIRQALSIREGYLTSYYEYNESVNIIQYLTGVSLNGIK
ncbi:MAG: CusA/CzcA family heavy metal efflux RND transporter [Chryseolinea sp.]